MVRGLTMEQTFYEDPSVYGTINGRENSMGQLKRNLTLDLNGCQRQGPQAKRPRLGPLPQTTLNNVTPILPSPDLGMLKLNTPELEKLFMAQHDGLVSNLTTPTQILFPKTVPTEAQELFTRGFVEALNELHHSDSSQEPGSIHGATYTTLEPPGSVQSTESTLSNPALIHVKDEPQTVSSTPPMSPIDMENQEKIKLERKRQRNRVAASKCRRRKLERISRLEDKVKLLKGENNELSGVVHKLKEHVCRLKEQVMDHVQSGCHIMSVAGQF